MNLGTCKTILTDHSVAQTNLLTVMLPSVTEGRLMSISFKRLTTESESESEYLFAALIQQ